MEESIDILSETKTILNSLVIPHRNGVSLKTLIKEYNELEGKDIPYKELGFSSITAFVKSMPDSIRIAVSDNQFVTLYPIITESNEHIVQMVAKQCKSKGEKKFAKRISKGGQKASPRMTPSVKPMDPRLAKRQRVNESTNNNNDSNEWTPEPQTNGQTTSNDKPSVPFHLMSSQDVESMVSAVRQTTSVEKAKNGIDSQLWSEIFDVKKVTNLKVLPVDTNGMMAAKTSLRQPLKIGEYSLKIGSRDDSRLFINSNTELKYLHIPPAITQINLDLSHGYDYVKDIHWGKPSNTKIDELLKWILLNRKKFMVNGEYVPKELHTDFVCYRGIMSKIMTTPYENIERWVICATKFKGTIYLCQFHESYPPPDDYFNKLSFGGFRFEQYLTSYDPNLPPDPNDFDPDHHEYCSVMRTRLMSENISHSLAFGAELDCVLPNVREIPGTLTNFVELKTTKKISNENDYRIFLKHKLLKWWAQSYMVGVPTIYAGYKDRKGIVTELEALRIDSFPDLCLEFWSANVCLNFLNRFLSHLKEVVTIDDPNVVYQFAFQPQQDISCTRLVEPGDFQILPDWYIKEFAI